ncbi:MAG: maltose alpha-D-glucosyltransferase [Calditrichaeota bacterium]|nr:maltose alpha-D-glucosyltransferase [Calditrichota bacterium]
MSGSEWYKEAIIYEAHVRSFADSSGDGIGDFRGLTKKLDYLSDLGITAIWLLPFYPSPLRDDGYDIADYTRIHPNYGTLRDVKLFLKEAHRRGLRVITELVLNHTSDQHPWFQRARRSPIGSRYRDYYVWSDTPDRYRETRIIFKDFEQSNWTWDPVAGQYYWHRFYHHQPDLNFESLAVRRELFGILDHWLEMGVDGLRLDAVPYLYEREGTNCENLPETHNFLRVLRRHVDEKFPGRMLLAEANQWPDDAIAYFGIGDECQMAFHFPLMPRLFMAVRMEDRFPIIEILEQTPVIPAACQWALFLRNHDELTLEMVTDEERDYMYRVYASDPQARINLGIRRRLAPLLGNNRRKIELMNGLLFSLPGTPIIYYGDEIGMGDNIYLGDRNGVRTPMQWSGDRNAGFSRANPQQLFLPVIIDPAYNYETVNVETQSSNLHSLLWWMKRLIALRKKHRVFGLGDLEFLHPDNRKVLAFVRRYGGEAMLVMANLSRYVQPAKLDLSEYRGAAPVELFGQTRFPVIEEAPYFITMGPHSFYWFDLQRPRIRVETPPVPEIHELPGIAVEGHWSKVLIGRSREALEVILAGWLGQQRWFAGKSKVIQRVRLADAVPLEAGAQWQFLLIRVEYTEGEPELYQVPIGFSSAATPDPERVICRIHSDRRMDESSGLLFDAVVDSDFAAVMLESIRQHRNFDGGIGRIECTPERRIRALLSIDDTLPTGRLMKSEQSNSSLAYGETAVLKLFRRVENGANPELEIGTFLTTRRLYANTPRLFGRIEYAAVGEAPATLGVLLEYIPNQGDAAHFTIDRVALFYEQVLAEGRSCPNLSTTDRLKVARNGPGAEAIELVGPYLESARMIGLRTAELHLALASESGTPSFVPESFGELYQRSLAHGMLALTNQVFLTLRSRLDDLPPYSRKLAERTLDYEPLIADRFKALRHLRIRASRIRIHGDYHLGQLLCRGNDFIVIDFEGEPMRSIGERRIKRSPLKDVAGMLRSFHYAWEIARRRTMAGIIRTGEEGHRLAREWGRFWEASVSSAFLGEYLKAATPGGFLPPDDVELELLLDVLLMERAIYEIGYELSTRSDWVDIPLAGLLGLIDAVE